MRVAVNIYPWHLAAGNRELQTHDDICQVAEEAPELEFVRITDLRSTVIGNLAFAASLALPRIFPKASFSHRGWYRALGNSNVVPPSWIKRQKVDVLFAHEYFPRNLTSVTVPIVYETTLVDERLLPGMGFRYPQEARAQELNEKRRWGQASSIINVRDPDSAARFRAAFPELADKVRTVPPYEPYIPLDEQVTALRRHRRAEPIQVLFVGNQAHRKGLPILVEAIASLNRRVGDEPVRLTVVSRFLDGPVNTNFPWVTTRSDLTPGEVLDLMRTHHVLVLPTAAETFGIVLLEAMATGCVVVASDIEPLRTILDHGSAGVLLERISPAATLEALERLNNPDARLQLATRARERFATQYHHRAVARQYVEMFREAIAAKRN